MPHKTQREPVLSGPSGICGYNYSNTRVPWAFWSISSHRIYPPLSKLFSRSSLLKPASHRSAPFPSLNFYYSLTPYPSHRTRSHPLSGVLPSLVSYVTLSQSISSLSLPLPSIALENISGLIRKQPVLLTVTLALTLSRPCWGGSWFMPLNIFTHDLHRKLHRMLYSPRRDGSR